MLDFNAAEKEIERVLGLFSRPPMVLLLDSFRDMDNLPSDLPEDFVKRLKKNRVSYFEKRGLDVSGLCLDDSLDALKKGRSLTDTYVVLFMENIEDMKSLHITLMHEILGHYAVNRSIVDRANRYENAASLQKKFFGINEFNLFYDHILTRKRKSHMRSLYRLPKSYVGRFNLAMTILANDTRPTKLVKAAYSLFGAHLIKRVLNETVAMEIVAHCINAFLESYRIEDLLKLGGVTNSQFGSSIWEFTQGDMKKLKDLDLSQDWMGDALIFSWLLCPAIDWLMGIDRAPTPLGSCNP